MRHIPDFVIYFMGFFSTLLFAFLGIPVFHGKFARSLIIFMGVTFGLFTGFLIWQNDTWKEAAATINPGTKTSTLNNNKPENDKSEMLKHEDIYKLMVTSTAGFRYPGPLLYLYDSQFGKTVSPISLALYLEVSNNKSSISRIYNIETRALMRYDEGGRTQITQSSSGYKFSYIPSGKTVERWRTLHSVGFLEQIFYATNDGWSKCKRIDFSKNDFQRAATDKQLQPGESLTGWVFYEMEEDVRMQLFEIKQLEFTIKNSAGQIQIVKIDYPKEGDNFPLMSSGAWHFLGGYYDLSKAHFTLKNFSTSGSKETGQ